MGVTAVKRVVNRSHERVRLLSVEDPTSCGHGEVVEPGGELAVAMWIPWAATARDFARHHLELYVGGRLRYCLWQARHRDGDFVRFSVHGDWSEPGPRVEGCAGTADGDRELIVFDDRFVVRALGDDGVVLLWAS
jgi:hypothetical protein